MPRPRTIAIGDIHGCSTALDTLIDAFEPRVDDTVVTLGDYIDRGPDSRGVFDRLIDLSGRCRLVPILGNHDELLLNIRDGKHPIEWLLDIGGRATLESYGAGGDLTLIPDAHYEFLEGCRDFYETDSHIFLHANYYAELALDEQPVSILRWESLNMMTPRPHCSGKTVIVGHSSQKTGEVLDLGYLVCIDTYCHGGGWLTALDVDTGDIWQANQRTDVRQT
jgi:serine/threonine protein phosphatase 1